MLKRPFVSLFYSLKSKRKRYYWLPSEPVKLDKIFSIKQKYEIKSSKIKDFL